MNILVVSCGLVGALLAFSWLSARSYFDKGRLRGLNDATQEIARGLKFHHEIGAAAPESAVKAIGALTTHRLRGRKSYQSSLWIYADAAGRACWNKGYNAASKELAPPEGSIRIDFSAAEIVQLSWLAHLGFQHMMPNYRSFEIHRFTGEEDAQAAARAVGKLEAILPQKERHLGQPSAQFIGRQTLIENWWQPTKSGTDTSACFGV